MSAKADYPVMAVSCHPQGRLYDDVRRALAELDTLRDLTARMAEGLAEDERYDVDVMAALADYRRYLADLDVYRQAVAKAAS